MKEKFTFFRYLIYAILTYGLMEFMLFDAVHNTYDEQFSEASLVETGQNIILGLSLIFLARSKSFHLIKYLLLLIIGLFFIREQDAFLDDYVAKHAWKVLCGIYALLIGYKIYTLRDRIKSEIDQFMTSASSGILFIGLTTLLIFSRMFGRKKFWKVVEGTEEYTRNVKNAAEECTELFAYFLIFIGVVEFFFYAKKYIQQK